VLKKNACIGTDYYRYLEESVLQAYCFRFAREKPQIIALVGERRNNPCNGRASFL
jgi:hypothetical protein